MTDVVISSCPCAAWQNEFREFIDSTEVCTVMSAKRTANFNDSEFTFILFNVSCDITL